MSQADVFSILQNTLSLALELSLPLLLIGLVSGVLVSLFQAVTQINDSTLAQVPKIIAVFIGIALFGPWMFHQIIGFTAHMLSQTPGVGA